MPDVYGLEQAMLRLTDRLDKLEQAVETLAEQCKPTERDNVPGMSGGGPTDGMQEQG